MERSIWLMSQTQKPFFDLFSQYHLAEASTTEISKEKKPDSFEKNREIAKLGGSIAGNARKDIEDKTGKPIVSSSTPKKIVQSTMNKTKED
jgi:hypothetical protein